MIFITLGSREYQFNRLLKEIDHLIETNQIVDTVFAQIGQSDYIPKHYKYERFLSPDEFGNYQEKADIVITHGGTGAIVSALKKNKRVIAVPRLARYKEHTDDHQLQVTRMLASMNYLVNVEDIERLKDALNLIKTQKYITFTIESKVLDIINDFIESER